MILSLLTTQKGRAAVWKHFGHKKARLEENTVGCNVLVKWRGGATNLMTHLCPNHLTVLFQSQMKTATLLETLIFCVEICEDSCLLKSCSLLLNSCSYF